MTERIGEHYRLFTLKLNGIKYYFIARLHEKGIRLVFNSKGKAINHFEWLEKQEKNKGAD